MSFRTKILPLLARIDTLIIKKSIFKQNVTAHAFEKSHLNLENF